MMSLISLKYRIFLPVGEVCDLSKAQVPTVRQKERDLIDEKDIARQIYIAVKL